MATVRPKQDPSEDEAGRERSASSGSARAARKGFLLRVPPTLLDELRRWAAQDLRSVNAQIEYLLTEAVKRRRGES